MTNIKDVGNLARVSTASVSRYLEDPDKVTPELRKRIKDAVEKLNYSPSIIARGMRKQNTKFIALVVEDIASPAYAEMVNGAEQYASENNYSIVIINMKKDREKIFNEISSGNAFIGAIFNFQLYPEDEKYLINLQNKNFPFVITHSESLKNKYLSVSNNNYKATYDGTEFLIKNGHKKIAIVELNSFIDVVEARKKGFIDALNKNSINYDPTICFKTDLSIEGGFKVGEEIIKAINKFTAVFCFSDYVAIGLLKYLIKNNIKIPDDVSLLGFDDIEWTKVTSPALTTVHQRKRKLGYLSMDRLINFINKKDDSNLSIVLDSFVVERDSVKDINIIKKGYKNENST